MPLDFLKRKGSADAARDAGRADAGRRPSLHARGGRRPGPPAQAVLRGQEQRGRPPEGRPGGPRRAAGDAGRAGPLRDRGRRAAADRVQPGDADDRQPVRGDAVAQRPPRPLADHPARAGRARIDRCGRPRLRHVRLLAARRRGRHVRLPRVQRDRRRRGRALGRGDRRHDLPGRRRLGRQGRPRRHRPDRRQAARRASSATSWPASTRSG